MGATDTEPSSASPAKWDLGYGDSPAKLLLTSFSEISLKKFRIFTEKCISYVSVINQPPSVFFFH